MPVTRTSQAIDSPLLKLLQRDINCWRHKVKVQAMSVVEILICRCRELLLSMVDIVPPFRIDACEILSDHLENIRRIPPCISLFADKIFRRLRIGVVALESS